MKVSKISVTNREYKLTSREGTIKNLLVASRNRDNITQKSGIIYRYKCDTVECDKEYIGESTRTFGESLIEHLNLLSHL